MPGQLQIKLITGRQQSSSRETDNMVGMLTVEDKVVVPHFGDEKVKDKIYGDKL